MVTITVQIKKDKYETLEVDEAKELYEQLKKVFGEENIQPITIPVPEPYPVYPTYPTSPWYVKYPEITYSTTSDTKPMETK